MKGQDTERRKISKPLKFAFNSSDLAEHSDEEPDDLDNSRMTVGVTSMKSIYAPNNAEITKSRRSSITMTEEQNAMATQDHGRPRNVSNIELSDSCSMSSSITRFRNEIDKMKSKMLIFGQSLNLCKCIAFDFAPKVKELEDRLEGLETREKLRSSASNFSQIIKKNKKMDNKTTKEVKRLQMCGTEEEMREVAGKICRNYLSGTWKAIDSSELSCSRISGGLSNFLYVVSLPEDLVSAKLREDLSEEDVSQFNATGSGMLSVKSYPVEEPKQVLLRIYGQVHGERAMDAIVTESVIFTLLSERRLGPKLYGVFSGGRIEEFIPARPLKTKELAEPALSMKIAEKMAAIHCLDIPLSKEPTWLWKTMGRWLKTVKEERLATTTEDESVTEILKRLKTVDFEKEIDWLKTFLAGVDSPAVFCHNDMQEGNILWLEYTHDEEDPSYPNGGAKENYDVRFDESNTLDSDSSNISDLGEPKLYIIDFEYCAYNYRGFDIANHFQEWSYDYTNPNYPNYYENQENAPTLEQKEIFIREYLKHYEGHGHQNIDDVNHLLDEVDAFALASHLFWSLWSIVNASKSQIPFGYWEYGSSRLDMYIRLKQEVIKKDKFGPQKRKICEVDI